MSSLTSLLFLNDISGDSCYLPASQMQSLEKERFVPLGYGSQDASSWCDNVQLFGSIWLQKFALVVPPCDGTGYIFKAHR